MSLIIKQESDFLIKFERFQNGINVFALNKAESLSITLKNIHLDNLNEIFETLALFKLNPYNINFNEYKSQITNSEEHTIEIMA